MALTELRMMVPEEIADEAMVKLSGYVRSRITRKHSDLSFEAVKPNIDAEISEFEEANKKEPVKNGDSTI